MPNKLNLLNQKFGKLTVIAEADNIKNRTAWKCKCDCGKEVIKTTRYLKKYLDQCSCGCSRAKDIIGKQYGDLTVLRDSGERKHGLIVWECQCSCGNITYATTEGLRVGDNVSCGCRRYNNYQGQKFRKELIGKKFNKLIVIDISEKKDSQNQNLLICQCDCGNICEVSLNHLQTGNTQSCGCLIGSSIGEQIIAKILIDNNINFKQEYIFQDFPNRRYDFAIFDNNDNIIGLIEFDGEQHYLENSFFKMSLLEQQQRDLEKTNYAQLKNIPLVRIPYWEREHLTLEKLLGENYKI